MPKRHHPHAAGPQGEWSIGSSNLTPTGQSELLKDLGRQLRQNYQNVLKEPAPDRIQQLLERLEQTHYPEEEDEGL
ncbi:NepR family anti-sigma factor [Microvirga calopogonii]|uniref:NepR family anti-sigma factor n=1 Tax=Microvirga calopogonii TaxID=2078013 RepID=UPI000E0CCBC3|nr:NepR family anti-sigma factor [Microvirga calopogonii]